MPFTPYHFGPGLLVKSAAPRHFSLSAFIATQIAIDIESLIFLVRDEPPVHRLAHTFLVGSLIGLLIGVSVLAFGRLLHRWRHRTIPAIAGEIGIVGTLTGGLFGGASHVLLDSLMHGDLLPFRPFSDTNPFLGLVTLKFLHALCLGAAAIGILLILLRQDAWRQHPPQRG